MATTIAPPDDRVVFRAEDLTKVYRMGDVEVHALRSGGDLRRLLDDRLDVVALPADGLLLNDFLADRLGARPGDQVTVEFLEGRRETRRVPVAGVIREFTGVAAYMDLAALNRLLREGTAVSGAYLGVEPGARDAVVAALKGAPRVAGVTDRHTAIQNFYDSMADIVLTFAFFSTLLAGSIAFGVVYNSARIALAERARSWRASGSSGSPGARSATSCSASWRS